MSRLLEISRVEIYNIQTQALSSNFKKNFKMIAVILTPSDLNVH